MIGLTRPQRRRIREAARATGDLAAGVALLAMRRADKADIRGKVEAVAGVSRGLASVWMLPVIATGAVVLVGAREVAEAMGWER